MNTLNKPEQISMFRLLALRAALKLEIKGLKRHGESAFSIVKRELQCSGTKEKVLAKLNAHIAEQEAQHS